MTRTVIGILPNKEEANSAINDLREFGYNHSDISIIMKDEVHMHNAKGSKGGHAFGGLLTGATSGGLIGGLAGLLIGIGAITLPGIGALLVGGPIAAALGLTGVAAATVTGATTGIFAGGLVGGLIGIGLPQETALEYEKRIKEGGVLLAVPVEQESDIHRVKTLFDLHNADYIHTAEKM